MGGLPEAIIDDNTEGYFERVGQLDMAIQMRKSYPSDVGRETIEKDYRKFLQEDVGTFTSEEQVSLSGIIKDIFQLK